MVVVVLSRISQLLGGVGSTGSGGGGCGGSTTSSVGAKNSSSSISFPRRTLNHSLKGAPIPYPYTWQTVDPNKHVPTKRGLMDVLRNIRNAVHTSADTDVLGGLLSIPTQLMCHMCWAMNRMNGPVAV